MKFTYKVKMNSVSQITKDHRAQQRWNGNKIYA